jgi:hypothetical protein
MPMLAEEVSEDAIAGASRVRNAPKINILGSLKILI